MSLVIKLLLSALAVMITSMILPGVEVSNYWYAIMVAAVITLLNYSVKPLLILFTIPATVLTLGLFLLVINAVIILLADWVVTDGFHVDGFWWALLFSLILSFINSIFSGMHKKEKTTNTQVKIIRNV